jgi:hypothetical protein
MAPKVHANEKGQLEMSGNQLGSTTLVLVGKMSNNIITYELEPTSVFMTQWKNTDQHQSYRRTVEDCDHVVCVEGHHR